MRRVKWPLLVCLALFALWGLAGWLLLPRLLHDFVEDKLAAALRRPVTLGQLGMNPYRLSIRVRGLTVAEPGGRAAFVSFRELYADLSLASVWRRGLVLDELRLEGPYLRVARSPGGTYNFSDLLTGKPAGKPERPGAARFALGNVRLRDGAVDFVDEARGETHTLRELALTLPFASNFPAYVDSFLEPAVSGRADGRAFSLKGRSKAFAESLETTAEVRFSGLDLPRYARYLPGEWKVRVTSGSLDGFLAASYVQHRQTGPSLGVSGTLDLKGAVVEDPAGRKVLGLPLVSVAFGPVDLFARSARVARVRVESPELGLVRGRGGALNVAALVPPRRPEAAAAQPAPFAFRVDEFVLSGGKVTFADEGAGFRTALSPIEVAVRGLSNAPGEKAEVSVSTRTESGEGLSATAAVGLEPLEAAGQVRAEGVDLTKYGPYYRKPLRADCAGRIGVETNFTLRQSGGGPKEFAFSGLKARLRGLRVRQAGEKFDLLSLGELALEGGEVDPANRRATLGALRLSDGRLDVRRARSGAWNVQEVGPPPSPAPAGAAGSAGSGRKADPPWAVSVGRVTTKGVGLAVEDQRLLQPVRLALSALALEATGLSTVPGKQGSVSASFALNRSGRVSVRGPLTLEPFATRLALDVRNAEIAPFQPYFAEQLRALITSGAVGAEGVVTLERPAGKTLAAGFRGGAQVTDFSCIDKATDEDLLRFGALAFVGVDFRTSPRALAIDGISLTDYWTAATLNPDGTLNLSDAFAPRSVPAPAGPPGPSPRPESAAARGEPAAPVSVEVRTVTLQGGRVTFRDRQVSPAYTTTLADLGGRISGLSSQETRLADVDLRGKMDGYAPLSITGQIQPLRRDLFVDLKASFVGADLTSATPYAGKFAGYAIEKGKLSFDVRYKIEGRKLDSENVVVLDQFTFGERVESPTATKLPVRFAVALLKDRRGEIRLDLPVTGSLDDPQFSVGRVIWKMVFNLLAKAVTSPFKLIGSLFGGDDDLGSVEFEPGSAALTDAAKRKVASLSKALTERPGLRLEISGASDAERDRAPLQRRVLERRLKARKADELAAQGAEPGPVDRLTIAPEERAVYLAQAYRAGTFPKPATAKGEKELPAEEMEKLLLTHVQVTEEDLQALAEERAAAVRDAIVGAGGSVGTHRIFTTRSAAAAGEGGGKGGAGRVDFRLTE